MPESKNLLLLCILFLIALSAANFFIILDKKGVTGFSTHTAVASLTVNQPPQHICGDNQCTGNETKLTCSDDCLPVCGDFWCTGSENCASCPGDCGGCPSTAPSSSNGGGGETPSQCRPEWDCPGWSECAAAETQRRMCYNIGPCKKYVSKQEIQKCIPKKPYVKPLPPPIPPITFLDRQDMIFVRVDIQGQSKAVNIKPNEYVSFIYNGVVHHLQLRKISNYSLEVGVFSDPAFFDLEDGITYSLDFDEDGYADAYVSLEDNMQTDETINIIIKEIPSEEKPAYVGETKWMLSPAFFFAWALILIIIANLIWLFKQASKKNEEESKIKVRIKEVQKQRRR